LIQKSLCQYPDFTQKIGEKPKNIKLTDRIPKLDLVHTKTIKLHKYLHNTKYHYEKRKLSEYNFISNFSIILLTKNNKGLTLEKAKDR